VDWLVGGWGGGCRETKLTRVCFRLLLRGATRRSRSCWPRPHRAWPKRLNSMMMMSSEDGATLRGRLVACSCNDFVNKYFEANARCVQPSCCPAPPPSPPRPRPAAHNMSWQAANARKGLRVSIILQRVSCYILFGNRVLVAGGWGPSRRAAAADAAPTPCKKPSFIVVSEKWLEDIPLGKLRQEPQPREHDEQARDDVVVRVELRRRQRRVPALPS
jgi:hypothetical protein